MGKNRASTTRLKVTRIDQAPSQCGYRVTLRKRHHSPVSVIVPEEVLQSLDHFAAAVLAQTGRVFGSAITDAQWREFISAQLAAVQRKRDPISYHRAQWAKREQEREAKRG